MQNMHRFSMYVKKSNSVLFHFSCTYIKFSLNLNLSISEKIQFWKLKTTLEYEKNEFSFSGSIYSNIDANSNNIFMDMPNSDDSVTSPTQPTNENCHTVNNCTPPNYINKLYSMQTSYF